MVRTIPVYEALPRVLCAQAQALGVSGTKAIGENILLFLWSGNKVGNKVIKLVTHSAGDTHSSR